MSYVGLMENTMSSRTSFLPDALKSVLSEPASLRGAASTRRLVGSKQEHSTNAMGHKAPSKGRSKSASTSGGSISFPGSKPKLKLSTVVNLRW